MYGMSLFGPHRDDFEFILNDGNLSLFGSQGQMRAAILALKLSELYVIRDFSGISPILLLDDIFSEFDIEKRNKLMSYLKDNCQVIMTTTDLSLIDDEVLSTAKIFNVKDGKVTS